MAFGFLRQQEKKTRKLKLGQSRFRISLTEKGIARIGSQTININAKNKNSAISAAIRKFNSGRLFTNTKKTLNIKAKKLK